MTKSAPFEVRSFIVAEDVRLEATGKHTIVGAYPGGLSLGEFPARIPVAVYVEFSPKSGRYGLRDWRPRISKDRCLTVLITDVALRFSVRSPRAAFEKPSGLGEP